MNVCTFDGNAFDDDWKHYAGMCEEDRGCGDGDMEKEYVNSENGCKKYKSRLNTILNSIAENGHPWKTQITKENKMDIQYVVVT